MRWAGGSVATEPFDSQLPVLPTIQRSVQLSSSKRKSATLPTLPSLAAIVKPFISEALINIARLLFRLAREGAPPAFSPDVCPARPLQNLPTASVVFI